MIARIRSMIEAGMSDDDIADSLQAAEEHGAAYGQNDYNEGREFDGPAHLQNDCFYRRNDAGEYSWM